MRAYYLASDPRMRLDAPTGYGSHIRKTIAALEHEGWEVVRAVGGDLRDISRKREIYRKAGAVRSPFLRALKSVLRDVHEVWDDRRSFRDYQRLLAERPCEFIYERMAPFRAVGLRLARAFGIPLILEINDPLHETFRYYPSPLKRHAFWTERRLARGADGIILGSRRLRDHYVNLGVAAEKVEVLYPTADYDLFRPGGEGAADPAASRAGARIGFVGNMRAWHRADLLLKAFAGLGAGAADRLVMVGDGPELESLKSLAAELRLGDRVEFLGSVKYSAVPGLLASFDICVIPHATWYGSPTKLFEYGAMAKAVVGPRNTPVDEVLRDGETGCLFDLDRVDQLTAALQRLKADPEERQRLGGALRRWLLETITWPRNVAAILRLAGCGQEPRVRAS